MTESRHGLLVVPERPSFEETAHRRAVGARIAELRRAKGLTQLELAGRADLHRPYVTGIERGSRNPSLDALAKIARALQVPLIELFRFDGR